MKSNSLLSLILIMSLVTACEPDEKIVPVVETYTPEFVASTSATIGVRCIQKNGSLLECGIYIGTTTGPDQNGFKIRMGTDTGLYLGQITGLTPSVTYYLKAYAINTDGEGLGYETSFNTPATVLDADNNEYPVLKAHGKYWMAKNLRTTKFANGDNIPTTSTPGLDITSEIDPIYRWSYNGSYDSTVVYGNLYSWFTATDSRNVCPTGWHLPTDAEWTALENLLGTYTIAGSKLKESGNDHWIAPYNSDATNESCFTALPGGYRPSNGSFALINNEGRFWTATESETANAWSRTLTAGSGLVSRTGADKKAGLSVRCIKD